jgi:Mg-chelatase subunit ChlI
MSPIPQAPRVCIRHADFDLSAEIAALHGLPDVGEEHGDRKDRQCLRNRHEHRQDGDSDQRQPKPQRPFRKTAEQQSKETACKGGNR